MTNFHILLKMLKTFNGMSEYCIRRLYLRLRAFKPDQMYYSILEDEIKVITSKSKVGLQYGNIRISDIFDRSYYKLYEKEIEEYKKERDLLWHKGQDLYNQYQSGEISDYTRLTQEAGLWFAFHKKYGVEEDYLIYKRIMNNIMSVEWENKMIGKV